MSDRNKPTGITRLLRAFGYSFQGFRYAWREEAAFRQEVLLSLLRHSRRACISAIPASSARCWYVRCC